MLCTYIISGQNTVIPKPELRGFGVDSLTQPPFGVTSAEVAVICPDIYIYIYRYIYIQIYIYIYTVYIYTVYIYASGQEALDSQHCKCWESYSWRGTSTSNGAKIPTPFVQPILSRKMRCLASEHGTESCIRPAPPTDRSKGVMFSITFQTKTPKTTTTNNTTERPQGLVGLTLFSLISTLPREFFRFFSFFKRCKAECFAASS